MNSLVTDAARRAAVLGAVLLAVGVFAHRLEPVLLAAPLLLSAALGLVTRRLDVPEVDTEIRAEPGGPARLRLRLDTPEDAEVIAVRLPVATRPGVGEVHLLPAGLREVTAPLAPRPWGELTDARCDVLAAGPDGLLACGPVTGTPLRQTVLPPLSVLPVGPVAPRGAGLVGTHRAPRPGDGTELRDIRPFRAGDRLRRIDWRVSLRATAGGIPGALHVRELHAEADGDVVFLLDTRADAGPDPAEWTAAVPGARFRPDGSLDAAARAITALAAGFLAQADRVGLLDLGRPWPAVPVGSGRHQLRRVREQLVISTRLAEWTARPKLRAQRIPPGALVVLVSPFLDDAALEPAVHAARRGARVLALDVLPAPLRLGTADPLAHLALRILQIQRTQRLAILRERGVPVVAFREPAMLPDVFRRLARPGRRR